MDPNQEQNQKGLGAQVADAAKKEVANQAKRQAAIALKKLLKKLAKVAIKLAKKVIQFLFELLVKLIQLAIHFWPITIIIIIIIVIICIAVYQLDMSTNSDSEDLTNVAYSTDILYDYIRIWENITLYEYYIGEGSGGKYVGSNGYYTVYYGGSSDPTFNISYGVVLYSQTDSTAIGWNASSFAEAMGVSVSEAKEIMSSYKTDAEEFTQLTGQQIETMYEGIVEDKRTEVKDKLGDSLESSLTQYQIDALTAVKYQYGDIGNFTSVYHYYEEGDKDTFISSFVINGYAVFQSGWEGENSSNNNRAQANWRLFDTGVYSGDKYTLDPSDYTTSSISSTVVETVIAYAEKAAEEEWTYSQSSRFTYARWVCRLFFINI